MLTLLFTSNRIKQLQYVQRGSDTDNESFTFYFLKKILFCGNKNKIISYKTKIIVDCQTTTVHIYNSFVEQLEIQSILIIGVNERD